MQQQPRAEKAPAASFDEASMERSKSFVMALQELKSLRPQLYSAAEYCEKSYLHSEQKQMVLDNLKDYAVRALVNAVDHLGTVAYKLADLFDQHTVELATVELRVSCLDQRLHTCKVYTDKEGMRQQQLFTTIPRHHKHYILPNSFNRKVHFTPHTQTDSRQKLILAGPRLHPSGTPASNTLSWHLASETNSTLDENQHSLTRRTDDPRTSGKSSTVFHLLDGEGHALSKSSSPHHQKPPQRFGVPQRESPEVPRPITPIRSFEKGVRRGFQQRESLEISKPMTPFRSFDKVVQQGKLHVPSRSKSILSAFFPKPKTRRLVS